MRDSCARGEAVTQGEADINIKYIDATRGGEDKGR